MSKSVRLYQTLVVSLLIAQQVLLATSSALVVFASKTTEATGSAETEPAPSPSPEATSNASPEPSPQVTAANTQDGVTSGQDQPTATVSSSLTSETTNTAAIEREVSLAASTGDNRISTDPSPAPSTTPAPITTGQAVASAQLETVANTTVVGHQTVSVIDTYFDTPTADLDYSGIQIECQPFLADWQTYYQEYLKLTTTNSATVDNQVSLVADTGTNQGPGDITTGSALTEAEIATIVNTNVIGNCSFFSLISFFDPFYGNLILPYEQQFLGGAGSTQPGQLFSLNYQVHNQNAASITDHFELTAESGGNEGGRVTTGQTSISAQSTALTNTNYSGNNWLLIEIVNPEYWKGTIEGLTGQFFTRNNILYFFFQLPELTNPWSWFSGESYIANDNDATITNRITAQAQTGNNTGGADGAVTTGEATVDVEVLSNANTNLVGDNWYFTRLVLFDDFTGTIIFPRSDLALRLGSSRRSLNPGDQVSISLDYANGGRLWAKDSQLTLTVPSELQVVGTSQPGTQTGSGYYWNLGQLPAGALGRVVVTLKAVGSVSAEKLLSVSGQVRSQTLDSFLENNAASLSLRLVPVAAAPTSSEQPQTQLPVPESVVLTQPLASPAAARPPRLVKIAQVDTPTSNVIETMKNQILGAAIPTLPSDLGARPQATSAQATRLPLYLAALVALTSFLLYYFLFLTKKPHSPSY